MQDPMIYVMDLSECYPKNPSDLIFGNRLGVWPVGFSMPRLRHFRCAPSDFPSERIERLKTIRRRYPALSATRQT